MQIDDELENFLKDLRVLIIEDDEIAQKYLVEIVSDLVKEVFSASNGESGLTSFKENLPDIVISDINMPILNGLDMASEIKKIDEDVPVIIVTALNEIELLKQAIEIGIDRYISKPVDPEKLIFAINKCATMIYSHRIKLQKRDILLQEAIISSKNEILQDIAHHWRNPLNVIALISDNLQDKYLDESYDDYFIRVRESSQKIDNIVHSLSKTIDYFARDFTLNGQKSNFLLNESVQKMLLIFSESFKEHNISIELNIDNNIEILGYKNAYNLVVYQIIKNAYESISKDKKESGLIKITGFQDGDFVYLEVCDNGLGVSDDIAKKIFEPYFSTKGPHSGNGIGLFMAKKLIEQTNESRIEWKNSEVGACFKIKYFNEN